MTISRRDVLLQGSVIGAGLVAITLRTCAPNNRKWGSALRHFGIAPRADPAGRGLIGKTGLAQTSTARG
jgi:hypothetical protein